MDIFSQKNNLESIVFGAFLCIFQSVVFVTILISPSYRCTVVVINEWVMRSRTFYQILTASVASIECCLNLTAILQFCMVIGIVYLNI